MRSKSRRPLVGIIIFLLVVLFLTLAAYYVIVKFRVESIIFEGTDKYTDEELKKLIFGDENYTNMLKLDYDVKHGEKKQIPFIQTYEVTLQYPGSVHVTLYEKSISAYVIYKESYMYMDKDGIIVESSPYLLEGIPLVDGLHFKSIVLYSPLPVDNEEVFDTILNISQYITKYELSVDKIHFNDDYSINLHMGDVMVSLGDESSLSEKLHELKQMEKELSGLSGTLYMENFKEGTEFIRFKKNEP